MAKPQANPRSARALREPDGNIRGRGQFLHEATPPPAHRRRQTKPVYLLVCEGPTESAYFETLAAAHPLTARCEVLPRIEPNPATPAPGIHRGDTTGLLLTAMQKMRMTRVPYDAVWIVTDNDEGEGYKLDNNSLKRIARHVPPLVMERMEAHQWTGMHVRAKDSNRGDDRRERYFLHILDYQEFLHENILLTEEEQLAWTAPIIRATTHKTDYSRLYGPAPGALFFEADGTFKRRALEPYYIPQWQQYIRVGFSSISFEHWLLLHYERCQHGFYNSREFLRYFDDRGYFGGAFHKGWWLYENRKKHDIQHFISRVEQAIRNGIWLRHQMEVQFRQGKKHYEINPYTDVYLLVMELLYTQVAAREPVTIGQYRNLTFSREAGAVRVFFDQQEPPTEASVRAACVLLDLHGNHAGPSPEVLIGDQPGRYQVRITFPLTVPEGQPVFAYISQTGLDGLRKGVCLL